MRRILRLSSVMILAGLLVLPAFDAAAHKRVSPSPPPASGGPQTTWTPVGTVPLSDATAAALVVHQPDSRPDNSAADDYVPSDAQLGAFQSTLNAYGETPAQHNPLYRYVTGRPGLAYPSTDDLIQWAAHKWGIPEDVIRAQMAVESWWHQSQLGDRTTVSATWYGLFPAQAQIAASSDVYESMGVMQIRWHADNSLNAGSEPLRWQSTAFNLDYYAASIRYYYDGYCSWCSAGYTAGQAWNSIGAWYEPSPWGNADAQSYVQHVQGDLTDRVWAQPGF